MSIDHDDEKEKESGPCRRRLIRHLDLYPLTTDPDRPRRCRSPRARPRGRSSEVRVLRSPLGRPVLLDGGG